VKLVGESALAWWGVAALATLVVLVYPTNSATTCPALQSMCLLSEPVAFVIILSIFVFLLLFVSRRDSFALPSTILFAIVFFGFFLIRLYYPRNDELGSLQILQYILQTSRIPPTSSAIAWESPSMPTFFVFSSTFQQATGMSPLLASSIIRVCFPVALAIAILAISKKILGKNYTAVTILVLIGGYGFADVFQFTPIYFGTIITFFLIYAFMMMRPELKYFVILSILAFSAIMAHIFMQIFVLPLVLSIAVYSRNDQIGSSIRRFILPIAAFTLIYDIYYVTQFGGWILSGLRQAQYLLYDFSFGTDQSLIQSHISLQPWWSVYTVYFWIAATAIGLVATVLLYIRYKDRNPIALISALLAGTLSLFFLQTGSGIVLTIFIWITPFALLSCFKYLRVAAKAGGHDRSIMALMLIIAVVLVSPSFLTYNSVIYTQTVNPTDLVYIVFSETHLSLATSIYSTYPNPIPSSAGSVIYPPGGDPASTHRLILSFLDSDNSIFYIDYSRTIAAYEFNQGLNRASFVALFQSLSNSNLVYSTSTSAIYST
jgi:hypothetical protein